MKGLKKWLLASTALILGIFLFPRTADAAENVANYTVNGTTVTVNTSSADTLAGQRIEAALDYAKVNATDAAPITVKVPAGDYTFTQTKAAMYGNSGYNTSVVFRGLHIYSNTLLDVSGCTFRMASGNAYLEQFVQFGNLSAVGASVSYNGVLDYNRTASCAGYGGFKNIGIYGGTWVGNSSNTHTLFKFYHATNVELRNMTITGGGAKHHMEVAAMDNFRVTGCTFKDYSPNTTNIANEALQLDVPANRSLIITGYEDGTPNQNVTISGCTFSNVPSGIGTHSAMYGAYHRNITITGNTFSDIPETAIAGVSYENCQVTNNKLTNVSTGITMQAFRHPASTGVTDTLCMTSFNGSGAVAGSPSYNGGIVISGNTISAKNRGAAISVEGIVVNGSAKSLDGKSVPNGNYYLNNVNISANTITTGGQGIIVSDTANADVYSNRITGKGETLNGYYGILAKSGSSLAKIEGNKLVNMGSGNEGIYISSSVVNGDIKNNKIARNSSALYSSKHAIAVVGDSSVMGEISHNTITKPSQNGVIIYNGATASKIASNKITASQSHAIRIAKAMTNGATISSNQLLKCGGRGISVSTAKTDQSIVISGNKLTTSAGTAAGIYAAGAKVQVSGNRMTGWKYGIQTAGSAKGTIYANKYAKTDTPLLLKGEKTYALKAPNISDFQVSGGSNSLNVSYAKAVFLSTRGGKDYAAKHYKITYATKKDFTDGVVSESDGTGASIVGMGSGSYYVTVQGYRKFNGMTVYTNLASIKKVRVN